MDAANQTTLDTKLDLIEIPWQFSGSSYSTASGWHLKKNAQEHKGSSFVTSLVWSNTPTLTYKVQHMSLAHGVLTLIFSFL